MLTTQQVYAWMMSNGWYEVPAFEPCGSDPYEYEENGTKLVTYRRDGVVRTNIISLPWSGKNVDKLLRLRVETLARMHSSESPITTEQLTNTIGG